jgi:hypothetical protein
MTCYSSNLFRCILSFARSSLQKWPQWTQCYWHHPIHRTNAKINTLYATLFSYTASYHTLKLSSVRRRWIRGSKSNSLGARPTPAMVLLVQGQPAEVVWQISFYWLLVWNLGQKSQQTQLQASSHRKWNYLLLGSVFDAWSDCTNVFHNAQALGLLASYFLVTIDSDPFLVTR